MSFILPRLRLHPGAGTVAARVAACLLLAFAAIHLTNHYSRTRLGLSGDEYYFYYAAATRYVDNPSDPIWAMQEELRSASKRLEVAAAGSAQCAEATERARGDLNQLSFLLQLESSAQGYGPGSAFQGAVLRTWEAVRPASSAGATSGYAFDMGSRIAASIVLPMAVVIAVCFLGLSFSASVTVLCALGLYVVMRGMVSPAAEAYWTAAEQSMHSAWWILERAVIQPFLNPRYSDSLVAIAPRGYLMTPFLLALGLRWAGFTRWSYAVAASLPLFHPINGTMAFAMLSGVDLVARPRVLVDRVVAVSIAAVVAMAIMTNAGGMFVSLAGSSWFLAALGLAAAGAFAWVIFMPRHPLFREASERLSGNLILVDVLVYGPIFLAAWLVLATLHARFGLITGYGLVNLAIKSAAVAHQVFFFGLFCAAFAVVARSMVARWGEHRSASVLLFMTVVVAGGLAAFGPREGASGATIPRRLADTAGGYAETRQRLGAIAAAHDVQAASGPLKLGEFQTHLLWHRIVRQRETGGSWVRTAIDLSPYRAVCGLP